MGVMLSEIRLMSFDFAPVGWAPCNGQFLPVHLYPALFSLLGTTYGGDGVNSFALPDLRARVPIHVGSSYALGARGGEATHRLTQLEMPAHTHTAQAADVQGVQPTPGGAFLAISPSLPYVAPANLVPLTPGSTTVVGASAPHPNQQPYLTLMFCIAMVGEYPTPPEIEAGERAPGDRP